MAAPVSVHEHSATFMDRAVRMHVVRMADSFYAWVGDDAGRMGSLAFAIQTRFDAMPSSRDLLQAGDDGLTCGMAARLSKRARLPVFLSVNVEEIDPPLAAFIERELLGLVQSVEASIPMPAPAADGTSGGGDVTTAA